MTTRDLTCTDVEARVADYLEGDLDAAVRTAVERHLGGCRDCSGIVADLRSIVARAAMLPAVAPERDLWGGIEARIEAPVIGIGAGAAGARPRRSLGTIGTIGTRGWLAIAAGLVLVTAGTTFTLTRVYYGESAPAMVAVVGQDAPVTIPLDAGARDDTTLPAPPDGGAAGTPAAAARAGIQFVARTSAEVTYDTEIARLRKIVDTRRTQLDPATIAVIERSLAVIDEAILQSRAALSRDPRSGFLIEQLNNALDKKVDLLRTAALLPARS
ncbi:MAG TPA: zf-HC2 domain-containing protein [Gemmatimonadaceae bacterium]|nr:zf-HC2 domain-containing protein [Gemmatimonadaceae bacterium]